LFQQFVPPARQGAYLLTTRQTALGTLAQILTVPPLPLEDGKRLLLRRANRLTAPDARMALHRSTPPHAPAEVAAAGALVELLEGLPLALDQAGAYVEETAGSLPDYLHLYQSRRADLLSRRGRVVSAHPAAVVATWSIAFERLEEGHPAAADLLRLCAFLSPRSDPRRTGARGITATNVAVGRRA
jgi:hypothetical protein